MRTLYFVNIYYLLDGNLTILNDTCLIKYQEKELFWVYDYDNFKLIDFTGTLVRLTFNNFYYHEVTRNLNLEQIVKQPPPSPNTIEQQFNTVVTAEIAHHSTMIQTALNQLIQYIFHVDVHHKAADVTTSNSAIIEAIVKHINQCSTDKHSCLWFAQRYYLNYSYLSREFSTFMSCPLSEYILGCKIHASTCELSRGRPSEQLWEKYNFKSHQDYIAHFQRFHHCSPHEIVRPVTDR